MTTVDDLHEKGGMANWFVFLSCYRGNCLIAICHQHDVTWAGQHFSFPRCVGIHIANLQISDRMYNYPSQTSSGDEIFQVRTVTYHQVYAITDYPPLGVPTVRCAMLVL
jgi:hypothetical protein